MSLLNRHVFKPETANQIEQMGLTATQIADRWAGGWPKRVRKLESEGRLIPELQEQTERELDVKARAREMSHLAQHEINQMYGIDPSPPI
jgi:hypothetical protein